MHRLLPLLAGLTCLLAWYRPLAGPGAPLPRTMRCRARVLGVDPIETGFWTRVRIPDGRTLRLRGRPPLRPPRRGDLVVGRVELWELEGPRNPGGRDLRAWAHAQGVAGLGVWRTLVRLRSGPDDLARRLALRRDLVRTALLAANSDPPVRGLLRALALGESGAVPSATRADFARAGLAHLLAISGLHLSLVGAGLALLLLQLLRRLRAGRQVAIAVALPCLALCVAWTGAGPSALRAGWMLLAGAAGLLALRPVVPLHLLAAAVLLLLVLDPSLVHRMGFQFSAVATAALLRMPPAPTGWLRRLVSATLVASLATAPLSAWYFGRLPLVGVLGNLLAVPLTALLLLVVLPATVLSAAGLPVPFLWSLAGRGASALAALAHQAAALPLAALGVPRPAAWVVLASTGIFLVSLGSARRGIRLAGAAAAVGLLLGTSLPAPPPPAPLAVTFLDVGHGDAVVVRTPAGDLLVDTGGSAWGDDTVGERIVVPALRALGVRRLRAVVITHAHPDHFGALPAVLRSFPVEAIYHPGRRGGPRWEALLAGTSVPIRQACRDPLPDLAPVTVRCLWPEAPNPLRHLNDDSVVLRLALGAHAVLLTGDIEAGTERALLDAGGLDATVVKAPHHGSATSSTPAFVLATGAHHVIFSSDGGRRFPFPAPEVEARWRAAAAVTWRTDRDGAVHVWSDGRRLKVWSHLRHHAPPRARGSRPRRRSAAARSVPADGNRAAREGSGTAPPPVFDRGARGGRG